MGPWAPVKTHQFFFSVQITLESIIGYFGFMFEENSSKENP